MTERVNQD